MATPVTVTISWPAVDGATGYSTRLTVPRIGTELHNSPSNQTSYTVTLQDGDRVHQETITSGVDSSYSKDFEVGSLEGVHNLQASFAMIPGLMTLAGLQDINPGPGVDQSQAASLNGTYTMPNVLVSGTLLAGIAKVSGIDRSFYVKYGLNNDGSIDSYALIWSENGGLTGSEAFLATGLFTFNKKTGIWAAGTNDDGSSFAHGGTMQLQMINYTPPPDN